MPIYEYACDDCGTIVEKVTNVAGVTAPQIIGNNCLSCGKLTAHTRRISAPARVGTPPPVKMSTENKDKSWKKRVLAGVNPDGKPLTNRVAESAKAWGMSDTARITGKV